MSLKIKNYTCIWNNLKNTTLLVNKFHLFKINKKCTTHDFKSFFIRCLNLKRWKLNFKNCMNIYLVTYTNANTIIGLFLSDINISAFILNVDINNNGIIA